MRSAFRSCVVLLIAVAALSCAPYRYMDDRFGAGTASVDEARVAAGDDLRWAGARFDDRGWTRRSVYDLPAERLWLRSTIILDANDEAGTPAIYTAMLAPHEVFWDGRRIGSSGVLATGAAGPMDNFFLIPRDGAVAGRHLLAIRIAPRDEARRIPSFINGIAAGDYQRMMRRKLDEQLVPVAASALFLLVGIYFAALWAAAVRSPAVLTFAALCFASAALAVAEAWRWIAGYTFDWHLPRLMVISALTYVVALLLVLFHVFELKLARPRLWSAACALALLPAAILPPTYDDRCLMMFRTSLVLCALALAIALPRRRAQAVPAAIGTALLGMALVTGGYGFSDRGFFLAFCAMVATLLLSTVLQVRHDRRARESALLRAARLENELLQKSIQPHFVMNTLTAAMEWIEEDPREGLKFLEAFAEELRIFAAVSKEPLVPLARELALCRSHLEVMNYRKAVRFRLESDGVDTHASIPPATLHTLVENAITHNRYREGDVVFSLREERGAGVRRWIFDAPIRGEKRARKDEGTGLRYVKARLEESFPGRWRFDAGEAGGCWRTIIEVTA